jgi:hypothetical protein
LLASNLAPFELSRRAARAKGSDLFLLKGIDQAKRQRQFRTNDDQVNGFLFGKSHNSSDIVGRYLNVLTLQRCASISRCDP